MKKTLAIIFSICFLFLFSNDVFSKDYNRGSRGYNRNNKYNSYTHHNYQHHNYNRYDGYRSHPFNDRNAYHQRYHNYNYRGHWRSWEDWQRFCDRHPEYRRHGRYERLNNHLYFMFNNGMDAFMFSIGR